MLPSTRVEEEQDRYSPVADRFYGRAPLRSLNHSRCDGWRFRKGDVVGVLALLAPVPPQSARVVPKVIRKRGVFPQHSRWFVAAELDFPFADYY